MSRFQSTLTPPLTPPLARRSTQLLLAGSVALLFVCQMTVGIQFSPQQDTATGQGVDVAPIQIDINQCESRELSLLPNVGAILAQRMISDRETNGPFRDVSELQRVHGIGKKTIARITPYCTTGKTAFTTGETARDQPAVYSEPVVSGNLIATTSDSQ